MLKYRNDIQGLRAISVLAVLIFHLDPAILPGGFLGVDIFFVISGYLITSILWRDLEADTFSFGKFYAKRIKRLFPALFTLLLGCTLAAYLTLYPNELQFFAKSLIATVVYVSNLFFLSEINYFSSDLGLSPLLHTWSLSVEEQFYLFFPVMLFYIYKKATNRAVLILIVIGLASLLLSEILIHKHPAAAFFLSPSRFYQFLSGSIIALIPFKQNGQSRIMEGVSWVGLGLIMASFFFFSESSKLPGLGAMIPTLAAALSIYSGQQNDLLLNRLLSHPLLVFIGKISYSLYLWHWPIIVFYKIAVHPQSEMGNVDFAGLFITSIVAGYLSWRFVEKPLHEINIRDRTGITLTTGLASSFSIMLIGVFLLSQNGIPARFTPKQLNYIDYIDYDRKRERQGICFLVWGSHDIELFNEKKCIIVDKNHRNILLLGDSHAAHFFSPLKESLPDANISQMTASGCKPTIDYKGSFYCVALMKKAFKHYVKKFDFDAIILSAYWKHEHIQNLERTVEYLSRFTDKVIVFGPIITYDQALPRLLSRFMNAGKETEAFRSARNYQEIYDLDQEMRKRIVGEKTVYVSILNTLCPDANCTTLTTRGNPVQWDYGHLTHEGGVEVISILKSQDLL